MIRPATFKLPAVVQGAMNWLLGAAKKMRSWSSRHGNALLIAGSTAFFAGLAFSISALGLKLSDIFVAPLITLVLVLVPITLFYSAINMQLMARAIGLQTSFSHALKTSAYAQVAELLPLPGAAIVRTVALMNRGGSPRQSASVVVAFALLWIACAAVGGGIALLSLRFVGPMLIVGGGTLLLATFGWLVWQAGWQIAAIALVLRVAGLLLVTIRIVTAFLVIGIAVGSVDALAFAFAIILGSAASIVPAGLGIGEGLSALLAQPSGVAPAAAFMATAINRVGGFAVNMLVAGLAAFFHPADLGSREQQDA